MKKIGIITLSASDNCGSLLQAYALKKVLENDTTHVDIINFESKFARKMYNIIHLGYIVSLKKFLGQFIHIKRLVNQKRDYNVFRRDHLLITNKVYRNSKELKEIDDGQYDLFIVGSDQVWNPIMADFDEAFILGWATKTKKISYAASMGRNIGKDKIHKLLKYKNVLTNYEAISLRESYPIEIMEKVLNKNISVCLDPTLLLSKDDWMKIVPKTIELDDDEFIFYYSYNYGEDAVNEMVEKISKRYGLPVYVINASRWVSGKHVSYGFNLFDYGGPLAYLTLMNKAKLTLVQSFHGVAFSYIFKKQFWFLEPNEGEIDDRISNLLNTTFLENRVIRPSNVESVNVLELIDYTLPKHNDKFELMKEKSLNYLRTNVSVAE